MALSLQYKRTTTFKDVIEIEVKVAEMSQLKISFAYTMRVGGNVVCTASSTHCFLENNKPVVLDRRFPELCQIIRQNMLS